MVNISLTDGVYVGKLPVPGVYPLPAVIVSNILQINPPALAEQYGFGDPLIKRLTLPFIAVNPLDGDDVPKYSKYTLVSDPDK